MDRAIMARFMSTTAVGPGLRSAAVDISLEGKVALVTGASKGIGRATAEALAGAGAAVVLSSRKQDALEAVAAEIRSSGAPGEVEPIAAHAGDPEAIAACVARTVDRFGAVDILVNNAATNPYQGPTMDIDLPRYDKTWEVNLRGVLVWVQEAWRASMRERGGNIVNIASIGGMSVEPSIGIYNATKAALIHLTRTLAAELSPGVRVNAVAPGLVKTDMARALWEPAEDRIAQSVPMRRLGEPVDIANAALFLASDLSSWVTGHTLVVDGGMLLHAGGAPGA
jgi:NAD(P)-dependent dehydrogenase (short-subunit alcohol dehydrogenase family)